MGLRAHSLRGSVATVTKGPEGPGFIVTEATRQASRSLATLLSKNFYVLPHINKNSYGVKAIVLYTLRFYWGSTAPPDPLGLLQTDRGQEGPYPGTLPL